jgi:tetratricopeptide (TPR) repeat protein
MKYGLIGLCAVLMALAAAYLFHLNADPVTVHVAPGQHHTLPLSFALLAALGAGAGVVLLFTFFGALSRRWKVSQQRRAERRVARRAAATSRARSLVWHRDYRKARTELQRRADGTVDPAEVALLAKAHLREGQTDAARQVLERALPEVGRDPALLDMLAEAAEREGDAKAATAAMELAHEAEPASPRFARRLRHLYTTTGRWQDAVGVQRELLTGTHSPAVLEEEQHILRGLRYQAACVDPDARRASRELRRLVREDPDFTPAWVTLGDRLAAAGRQRAARRVWERAARHRPSAIVLDRLEAAYAEHGEPAKVAEVYQDLKRRHPEVPAVGVWFARHLLAQGGIDRAAAELEGLSEPLASSGPVAMLWGDVHLARGAHADAADAFRRAACASLGDAFACVECAERHAEWSGRCPACGRWDTLQAPSERAHASA